MTVEQHQFKDEKKSILDYIIFFIRFVNSYKKEIMIACAIAIVLMIFYVITI